MILWWSLLLVKSFMDIFLFATLQHNILTFESKGNQPSFLLLLLFSLLLDSLWISVLGKPLCFKIRAVQKKQISKLCFSNILLFPCIVGYFLVVFVSKRERTNAPLRIFNSFLILKQFSGVPDNTETLQQKHVF